jgi:hypothetical protein
MRESLPALASNIYCTTQDRFAQAAVELAMQCTGVTSLEPAQWGAMQRILLRQAASGIPEAVKLHLKHQQDKAVSKEQKGRAGTFAQLHKFTDEVVTLADEVFGAAIAQAEAMWGEHLPKAELAAWLRGEAVRGAFGSLSRLARAYRTLDVEEREALKKCSTN